MENEFWAAVVGAVVGGIIAFAIQFVILRAAARQREEEAAGRRKALGHSLLFKMVKIHSHLHHFHAYLEEPFEREQEGGSRREPWQIVLPLASNPEHVHFSSDEMAMLLSLKNDDLFNDVIPMDEIHNTTIDLFHTFKERRFALTSQLPAKMEGMVGETKLTEEQMLFLRPMMVEVNDLITSMRQRCELDARDAWNVLTRLHSGLKDEVGLALEILPKPDKALGS